MPGLPAKPVLDVQAAVVGLECATQVAEVLAADGWHPVPAELDAMPWRRFLVQVAEEHRVAHLHVLVVGSSRWFEQLAFRDALRADASLVHEYAQLKRSLAAAHDGNREAYTEGRAEFVRRVVEVS